MDTKLLNIILNNIIKGNKEHASAALSQHLNTRATAIVNPVKESLAANASVKDYIDDFKDSDAPQFKGKSKSKRREMAVAAAMSAKDKK